MVRAVTLRPIAVLALAACGRIGFDAQGGDRGAGGRFGGGGGGASGGGTAGSGAPGVCIVIYTP
jgi:hypothetical protein